MGPTRKLFKFLAIACTFALLCLSATEEAQGQGAVTSATLAGEVFDQSEAVVPGAKVIIRNEATGLSRETVSDSSGYFEVSQLPAGSYEVTVEATGFKKAVLHDILLNIGATQKVRVGLELGALTETITVSGDAVPMIDTTRVDVSAVIQEVQVRELPLNQRSFTALVTQQPGLVLMTNASGNITQTPTSVAYAQGSMISSNGQISQSMAYLVDGVNINNSGFGAPGTAAGGDIPGVEAIQEFKVLSHNYSAAYGGSAGAVVSFATRSGTNEVHGSVYEFLRNDVFDARSFFDQENPPPYKRNQFGATLGGPIRRDQTFIFANYEGLRQRLTTTDIGTVPSWDARNGGLGGTSGLTVIGPILQPDGVTYLRGPVAISSGVQALLDLYPLQNSLDFGNGIAQYIFQNKKPIRQDFAVVKFDHSLSAQDMFMARYSITDAVGSNAYFLPTYSFDKTTRLQNVLLKWTRTAGTNFVNTLSAGFMRSYTEASTRPTVSLRPEQYTGNPAREVVGTISVGSATSGNTSGFLSTIGLDNWGPFVGVQNNFPINNDSIYTRGNHSFKFGGMVQRRQWNWSKGNLFGGGYTFNSLNDLLAGNPAVLIIMVDGAEPSFGYRTTQIAWYVEDAWRISPNLTLTAGLRHEFQVPVLSEVNNKLGNWRSQTATENTVGAPYDNYSLTQFQPRLGIAYDPFSNGKTVIRAGIGLFNDFIPLAAVAGELTYNDPQPTLNAFFGEPLAPDFNVLPVIEFPSCAACTQSTGYPGLLTGVLDPVRAPTSLQWHFGLERELPGKVKASATYIGSHTYNIMRGVEGNHNLPSRFENGQPIFNPPGGTAAPGILSQAFTLYAVVFDAHAFYHAGTFGLSRQFAGGLTFNTSYTFAKAISESDTNNSGAILAGQATHSQYPADRKNDRSESMMSIRHRLTLNAVYEFPLGRGRTFLSDAGGAADAVLGGWSLSVLTEARSGYPFSVVAGIPITGVGDTLTYPDRPNILEYNAVLGSPERYFDPQAYYLQEQGRLGTAPRNSVRGPGFATVDFALMKKFKASENVDITFRAEFFNILNRTNFDLPFNQLYTPATPFDTDKTTCNLTSAQTAVWSCNPQAGLITRTVGTPRQIQFGLKVTF
jgi:hypothetical protein